MFDSSIQPASTGTAMRTATQGVQRGIARAADAAAAIASYSAAEPADLAKAAVDMLQARSEVQANARVLRAADKMIGTLLDLHA